VNSAVDDAVAGRFLPPGEFYYRNDPGIRIDLQASNPVVPLFGAKLNTGDREIRLDPGQINSVNDPSSTELVDH
jgi:hypothetical protein